MYLSKTLLDDVLRFFLRLAGNSYIPRAWPYLSTSVGMTLRSTIIFEWTTWTPIYSILTALRQCADKIITQSVMAFGSEKDKNVHMHTSIRWATVQNTTLSGTCDLYWLWYIRDTQVASQNL